MRRISRAILVGLLLAVAGGAQATRDVVVPPAVTPAGGASTLELWLAITDASGNPWPAGNTGNTAVYSGLGAHTVTTSAVTLALPTSAELPAGAYVQVQSRQGQSRFTRRVSIPSGESALTWAAFLALPQPTPSASVDGRLQLTADERAALDAAANAPSAANPIATQDDISAAGGVAGLDDLLDGPGDYGTSGQMIQSTGTGWQWATVSGGGGDATDLGATYNTTAVTITSSTGDDVALSAAVAGTSAGIMSAAQAATLASALQTESDTIALAAIAGLDAGDVGADPAGTAAAAVSAHAAAADPHPGYLLESAAATVATTGAYSDLSGRPTLGTAAALDAGTGAGDLVQLDGAAKLPAVDGSALTGGPLHVWLPLVPGTLAEATAVWQWRIPAPFRLTGAGMVCTVVGAPNTGVVQVDLLSGDSPASLYGAGDEPEIESGETSTETSATPGALATDPTDLAAGTLLTLDVDSIGVVSPGSGLLCALEGYEL